MFYYLGRRRGKERKKERKITKENQIQAKPFQLQPARGVPLHPFWPCMSSTFPAAVLAKL